MQSCASSNAGNDDNLDAGFNRDSDSDGDADADTDSDADSDTGSAGVEVAFVVEPTLVGNDNPAVPQAAILSYETDVPATAEVTVSGGDEEWTLSIASSTDVTKPIVGLKPDTEYEVTLSVTAGANVLTAGPLTWTSPPLPDDFPPLATTISDPESMEPGMTMFTVRDGWSMIQAPLIIVDHEGVVRWYFNDPENKVQEDFSRLANGNFFFGRDFCNLREVDILGNGVRAWHAANYPRNCTTTEGSIPVPVVDFHHESAELASGNILVLSTETRTVEGFPTSEEDPEAETETAEVMGSVIVEFTPSGEIVKEISLMDLLDPTRIGRDSLDTSWPMNHLPMGERARDWDHSNAVIYDEASDSYLASLRHQDAVVKINKTDETLTWILGTPSNWDAPWSDKLLAPKGELTWPFHQHAVEINALGIGMYDNGNYRAAAYEPIDPEQTEYSRAVIYAVDESAMTVSEVWSFGSPSGEDTFFSPGMGDADLQPSTGNMLFVNSQILTEDERTYAEIVEVTPDGTRVFDLTIESPQLNSVYAVYRVERIGDIRQ
jgi:hypothetical protein